MNKKKSKTTSNEPDKEIKKRSSRKPAPKTAKGSAKPKTEKRKTARIPATTPTTKPAKKPKKTTAKPKEKLKIKPEPVAKEITPVVSQPAPVAQPPAPEIKPAPKEKLPPVPPAPPAPQKIISVNELTTTRDLAQKLNIGVAELIKKAMEMGSFLTINQRLDKETIEILAQEYNVGVKFVEVFADEAARVEIDKSRLKPRPPVVTVMGHVDHGKTTLLDAIRRTAIAEKEYGGITQHIGASVVKTPKGEIVFLDTPGHEAFTAMRARGARVTDIVILVVSAVDGVMPQTVEAINHARAAGVPIIVAINKIDVAGASPERIKQELSKYNLIGEDWGGDTLMVEVSAKKQINLDKLLEVILIQAEMLELKADPECPASGTIIEARLDPKKGPIATVLLQQGTLKVGQYFIAGFSSGKVRAMFDFQHNRISAAGPAMPVEILGFETVPVVGDMFKVVPENLYREIAWQRQQTQRDLKNIRVARATLGDLAKSADKVLNIILKSDVSGSAEAIGEALMRQDFPEGKLKIIHQGVGAINSSDIMLAETAGAIVIGFNVQPEPSARELAEREGVEIRIYRIIYDLLDDIKKAMKGLAEPVFKEVISGRAQVRRVFRIEKVGTIAGCYVLEGKIERKNLLRLLRDNRIIFEGKIASLRRFKDDVREVEKGLECGIALENFSDIKENDIIESYFKEKVIPE